MTRPLIDEVRRRYLAEKFKAHELAEQAEGLRVDLSQVTMMLDKKEELIADMHDFLVENGVADA